MNTHSLYFVAAMGMFFVALISIAVYYYTRGRRSSQARWEDLLAQLARIDRDNIAQVALDLVDESGQPKQSEDAASLEPWQLWRLIGGLEGLELLEANSEVLIDMAFYLQQWYPEAIVIAERLRLDARELKWHVNRLKGAAQKGNLQVSFPFYAQHAVATSFLPHDPACAWSLQSGKLFYVRRAAKGPVRLTRHLRAPPSRDAKLLEPRISGGRSDRYKDHATQVLDLLFGT